MTGAYQLIEEKAIKKSIEPATLSEKDRRDLRRVHPFANSWLVPRGAASQRDGFIRHSEERHAHRGQLQLHRNRGQQR